MLQDFYRKIIFGETINSIFIALTKPLALLNAFIIIGILSLHDYGLYTLVLSFQALVSGFSVNFMDNLVLNEMNVAYGEKNQQRGEKIFREFVRIKIGIGLALTMAIFFGASLVGNYLGSEVHAWVKIISFLFIIDNIKSLLLIFFQYRTKFFFASVYSFVYEALKIILIGSVFLLKGDVEVVSILMITVITHVLILPVFLLLLIGKGWKKTQAEQEERTSLVKGDLFQLAKNYGGWALARYYLLNFYQNMRPWLIKFYLGTEAVALFSVALSFLGSLKSLVSFNALRVFLPRALNNEERMQGIMFRGSRYITYLYGVLFLFGMGAVPAVVFTFFPKYASSLPYFYIMAFSMLFYGMTAIVSQILYSLRRQKDLFSISLICLVCTILLTALIVPIMGLYGFAFEFFITQVLTLLLSYTYLLRYKPNLRPSLRQLFCFDAYDRELWMAGWRAFKGKLKRISI